MIIQCESVWIVVGINDTLLFSIKIDFTLIEITAIKDDSSTMGCLCFSYLLLLLLLSSHTSQTKFLMAFVILLQLIINLSPHDIQKRRCDAAFGGSLSSWASLSLRDSSTLHFWVESFHNYLILIFEKYQNPSPPAVSTSSQHPQQQHSIECEFWRGFKLIW